MHKSPRRYFFHIVIVSAILHLIVLLIFLLSDLDSSVKKYKDLFAKKKQAQVVFKDPKKQAQKQLPKTQQKIYTPELVGGALSTTPSKSEIPAIVPQLPTVPKPIAQKEKPPQPTPEKTKPPVEKKTESSDKAKMRKTKIVEKKATTPTKKITEKKLTLSDIMKGFKKFAEENSQYVPPSQQHFVTVLSKNVGKVTEEQLKYERYTAKLFDCMISSFKLLVRKFRFIKKPDVSEVEFEFLIHLNKQGQLVSLKFIRDSNCQQFDRFMKKMIQHSSESFPPLPKFLSGYDICSFRLILPIPIAFIPSANLYAHSNNQW